MNKRSPVHIVINQRPDYSIADFVNTGWEKGEQLCSRYSWTWAVYQLLKFAGYEASVGYTYRSDAINFVHYYGVRAAGIQPHKYFTVYLRADYRSMPAAHLQIVQNKTQVNGSAVWIKHHPQPGLKGRDPRRKEVSNVAFFGSPSNTVKLSPAALAELKNEGLHFHYNTDFSDRSDYSAVDIAIGIREFSKERFDHKPGTKMTNAWLAGVPFIGGYDSAFEQNAKPGYEYIRVSSEAELISYLLVLKRDPSTYRILVENFRKKAGAYTFEACSLAWSKLIEERIGPEYRSWLRRSSLRKKREYGKYLAFLLKEKCLVNGFNWLKKIVRKR